MEQLQTSGNESVYIPSDNVPVFRVNTLLLPAPFLKARKKKAPTQLGNYAVMIL